MDKNLELGFAWNGNRSVCGRRERAPAADVTRLICPIEAALKQAECSGFASLQQLLEMSAYALLLTDNNGVIAAANRLAAELFGYKDKQLAAMSVDMLLPSRLRDAHRVYRRILLNDPQTRAMDQYPFLWALHSNGEEFCVQVQLSPIIMSGAAWTIAAVRMIVGPMAAYPDPKQADDLLN